MATLVYNRVYKYFSLLHGDNEKCIMTYNPNFRKLKEIEIPMFSEYNNENMDKFMSAKNYFQTFINDDFLYYENEVKCYFKSNSNNIEYEPLTFYLDKPSCYVNGRYITFGLYPTLNDILNFFDISIDDFYRLEQLMNLKKYDQMIIKNKIKVHLCKVNGNVFCKDLFTLVKGNIKKCKYPIKWTDRYKHPLANEHNIPKYHKKFFNVNYLGGTDGTLFVSCHYNYCWKNLYYIEPMILHENEIKEITDYDEPCVYSKEQKEYLENKEKEKRLKYEAMKVEIEANKQKNGYCDCCGSPNASYMEDPYQREINNISVMTWLCHNCYENLLGDI